MDILTWSGETVWISAPVIVFKSVLGDPWTFGPGAARQFESQPGLSFLKAYWEIHGHLDLDRQDSLNPSPGCRFQKRIGKYKDNWTYTVRKITSYNLYICGLHRIPCIDQDYNPQNIILVYQANMLYIEHIRCISTEYFQCQYRKLSYMNKLFLGPFF